MSLHKFFKRIIYQYFWLYEYKLGTLRGRVNVLFSEKISIHFLARDLLKAIHYYEFF